MIGIIVCVIGAILALPGSLVILSDAGNTSGRAPLIRRGHHAAKGFGFTGLGWR
jgi:hypothetical protein